VSSQNANVRRQRIISVPLVSIGASFDFGLGEFGDTLSQRAMAVSKEWRCGDEIVHEKARKW
jgi:hypothetical protein